MLSATKQAISIKFATTVGHFLHDLDLDPNKAQTVWCTLDNKAAGKAMPAVKFDEAVVEQTNHLRYLGVHFDRMLTYRQHVETTALKCRKGLSVLKAMAAKGIEQPTFGTVSKAT